MLWRSFCFKVFSLWLAVAPLCGWAQIRGKAHAYAGVDGSGNSETVEAALHQMTEHAGVIFVGTVAEIRRSENNGFGGGIVEIRFDVEQPVRGCSGSSYTLREWGGLWNANEGRYRVGQHLLVLLHTPGPTGLSSPVGGMDGAIPLRASGAGVKRSDASTAAPVPVADLRWIAAKLVRPVHYTSSKPVAMALARSADVSPAATEAAGSTDASKPAQEAAVSDVVSLIQSWGGQTDATR